MTTDDVQVTEGNGETTSAVFTVRLSAASGQVVTLDYATADGSATAPTDYTATAGTLSFPAGTTTRTVTVPVIGDLLDEANETFLLRLSNPAGALLGDAQATGTIVDDDPVPVFSIDDVSVAEGETATTPATFTLSLSAPSGQVVSVAAAAADATATAGADYTSGTWIVVLPPGDTTASLGVAVRGDRVWEADETFVVNLSVPVNATLAGTQGVGTILDDDPQGLSVADVDVVEPVSGTRSAVFTVTLSPTSGSPVTVGYTTTAVTATAGSDYDDTSGTLIFDPGVSTLPFSVTVRADTLAEGVESFRVDLSGPSGAAIAYGRANGRIHDPGNLFTVAPCRVLDTRDPAGPYGGPALGAGESRAFALTGRCGIPASARAVTLNLTVTGPTAAGNLRLYPANQAVPSTSTLNYSSGQTRANNAIVGLSPSGALGVRCAQAAGTAHVILDVTGYFE
jgi:chitinase